MTLSRSLRVALPFFAMLMSARSAVAAEPTKPETQASDQAEQEDSEAQAAAPPKVDPRALVARYYAGFHWGIDPGFAFGNGKPAFGIAVRLEYGIDTGTVIIAPGLSAGAYFFDPNVYIGMPTVKLSIPIGFFVPFIEGGAGVGNVTQPSTTGLALLGGGGFMIHPSPNFAFGVEAGYETIVGVDFGVIIAGPLIAIAF